MYKIVFNYFCLFRNGKKFNFRARKSSLAGHILAVSCIQQSHTEADFFQNIFKFCTFRAKFSNILPFFVPFFCPFSKKSTHALTFGNRPCTCDISQTMFHKLFTIFDAVGLEYYKIASKSIHDIFNSYSLHCQEKLKSSSLHTNPSK